MGLRSHRPFTSRVFCAAGGRVKHTGSDTQKVLDAEVKGPHGEALSLVSRNTVVPGQKLLRM